MTKKRRCLWPPGCITILSMYNPSNFCQTHQNAQVKQEFATENLKNLILVEEQQKKRELVIAVKEKPGNLAITKREITAAVVIKAVCQACAVNRKELFSQSRKPKWLVPRQIAVYLLHLDWQKTWQQIAKELKRESTSTVFYEYKRIRKLAAENLFFKNEIDKIRAYYLIKPS